MAYSKPSTRPLLALLTNAILLVSLVGCGGSPPPAPVTVFPNVTGNWQFEVRITVPSPPTLPTNPIETLFGSLSSTGGKVTGILNTRTIGFMPCIANNADLPVTGTIDATGNLNLTAPIAGGVATITASVGTTPFLLPPPLPNPNGTYQVIGGPCAQDSIGLLVFQIPNVSGTYAGTMTQLFPTGTGTLSVKATLVESATPNADGEFPLTGTITYTGDCSGTLSFNNGVVFGGQLQSAPISADFATSSELFSAGVPLRPLQGLFASFFLPAGCGTVNSYIGSLTLQ